MDPETTAALIAVGGVILTALITIITYIFTRKYEYRKLYAETVSQSRNKWLNEMRDFISTVLSEADKTRDTYKTKEFYKAKNEIVLRLNMTEPLHIMLANQLDRLAKCDKSDYDEIYKSIITISQQLLKVEWERVKKEANGGE